ncbi:ThiF family adenylyltransferase [Kineosporia sp. NBRC 101731]|uniref:ThiF family adenylyltransferase n=1 Tax=Kineosporia sp. NBRC 101731 TaxID=3032199 RepID=UPI00249FCACD|nr:ThiF family adenylyltransferase [Kineosporia sp. NBRC 101731]GLY27874.1 thiamin biosynthesis protein [Kineosporia sp. NBRC 101731]
MRIRLKPGFRRAWRDPATLQIGLSRRRGTVITGLTLQDIPLVEALHHGIDTSVPGSLSVHGDPERGGHLITLLRDCGVLVSSGPGLPDPARLGRAGARLAPDAAVWSVVHPHCGDGWQLLTARADRQVVVRGAGRLGSSIAATLAAAGVGTVVVQDPGRVTAADLAPAGAGLPDLGRPRVAVGQDLVRRAGGHSPQPDTRGTRGTRPAARHTEPDLVVLVDHGTADAARADTLMSADVSHLSVVVGEDGVVVGPLVLPGTSPCLRCLDLHRTDRDPAWPALAGQLRAQGETPQESASSALAAGLVSLQVLAHLDGVAEPAAVGATLEVELPDGLVARRPWPVHPGCGCSWTGMPGTENDADARGAGREGRM